MAPHPDEFKSIADALRANGWCVLDGLFATDLVEALAAECLRLDRDERLTRAAVGHGDTHAVRGLRGDRTRWMEARASPVQARFLARMDALRVDLNRLLLLGLAEFEAHYALYPAGARYARHVDRFRDDDARVLSAVLYLNPDWQDEDGGALRLYLAKGGHRDILPQAGRLVLFLSAEFEHEVLPPARERLSVAGWYRQRPLGSG